MASEDQPFIPFQTSERNTIPDFLPIGSRKIVRQTSSTHGADGYITTDAGVISKMQEHLNEKLNPAAVNQFSYHEVFVEPGAETLIITYGVSARSAKQVYNLLKKKRKSVSLLVLKTLWPVPEMVIKKYAENMRNIVVVEMNLGQYVLEIERILSGKNISFVGKMDGTLISPTTILNRLIHESFAE